MTESITQIKKVPVVEKIDVVVAGGGPAGLAAALAAARHGADTLLVERYAFLGGAATTQLVTGFPYRQFGPDRKIMAGIPEEIINNLAKLKPWKSYTTEEAVKLRTYVRFDQEAMKYLAFKMMKDAGVKMLVSTIVVDAIVENNICKGIVVENKSGRLAILAKMVIDCTGDGDVAVWAGAPYEKGRQEIDGIADGMMIPSTLVTHCRGFDQDRFSKYLKEDPGLVKALTKADNNGDLEVEDNAFAWFDWQNGYRVVNGKKVRLGAGGQRRLPGWHRTDEGSISAGNAIMFDSTNGTQLSNEEIKQRMFVVDFLMFMRKYVPGWENAYISDTAPHIGVRESRRIIGEYVLSREETDGGSEFDDVICLSCSRYVTPYPNFKGIDVGPPFMIPYRCIVPKKIDNLLVAGKCMSWTHGALANNPRDMNTCMALGQAAGTAVVLAIKNNVTPRNLDYKMLQEDLRKQGVILEYPEGTDISKIKEDLRKQGVRFWNPDTRTFEGSDAYNYIDVKDEE